MKRYSLRRDKKDNFKNYDLESICKLGRISSYDRVLMLIIGNVVLCFYIYNKSFKVNDSIIYNKSFEVNDSDTRKYREVYFLVRNFNLNFLVVVISY